MNNSGGRKHKVLKTFVLLALLIVASSSTSLARTGVGEVSTWQVLDVEFRMRSAQAATFPVADFRKSVTVENNFLIGETPVTYELWYAVRIWAESNGYTLANLGREGGTGTNVGGVPTDRRLEPVTSISWRDMLVWTNALSDYLGYAPVYTIQNEVIRDATDRAIDRATMEEGDGFRLPTDEEWELTARYRGNDNSFNAIEHPENSGNYWTPRDYASGASAGISDLEATARVSWYSDNSDTSFGKKTHDVGTKTPNALGIYDMSGNVSESVFSFNRSFPALQRGGSFRDEAYYLQVGMTTNSDPGYKDLTLGFRLAKTTF